MPLNRATQQIVAMAKAYSQPLAWRKTITGADTGANCPAEAGVITVLEPFTTGGDHKVWVAAPGYFLTLNHTTGLAIVQTFYSPLAGGVMLNTINRLIAQFA